MYHPDRLNSSIQCETHQTRLSPENALKIIGWYMTFSIFTLFSPSSSGQYDIIVDASDNAATRYLLSDVCVLLNKPLVSGAALRGEGEPYILSHITYVRTSFIPSTLGQLTTYHANGGPCYRCLFPSPPPPNTVSNCSDAGVSGPIVGIIGSFQAQEVIKSVALSIVRRVVTHKSFAQHCHWSWRQIQRPNAAR